MGKLEKAPASKMIGGVRFVCIHRYPTSKPDADVWATELRKKAWVNRVRVVKVKGGYVVYNAYVE